MVTRREFIAGFAAFLTDAILRKGIKAFGDVGLTVREALHNLSNLFRRVTKLSSVSGYSAQDVLNAIAYTYSYLSQFPPDSYVYSVLPSLFDPPSDLSVGPEEMFRLALASDVAQLAEFLDQYTWSIADFTEKIIAFGYTMPSSHKVLFTQYLRSDLRVRVLLNFYSRDNSITPVPEYEPLGMLEYYQNGYWVPAGLIFRSHWYPYVVYLTDLMYQLPVVNVTSDLPPVYYSGHVFVPKIDPLKLIPTLEFVYEQFKDEEGQVISSLKAYGYYYVYPWEALAWIAANQVDVPVRWYFSPYNRLSLDPIVFIKGNNPNATPYLPPSKYLYP